MLAAIVVISLAGGVLLVALVFGVILAVGVTALALVLATVTRVALAIRRRKTARKHPGYAVQQSRSTAASGDVRRIRT